MSTNRGLASQHNWPARMRMMNIPLDTLDKRELVYFLLKNRDFTCAWYAKAVPQEERLHRALIEAMHRGDEALAFVTLEIDRLFLRNAGRAIPALRLMLNLQAE